MVALLAGLWPCRPKAASATINSDQWSTSTTLKKESRMHPQTREHLVTAMRDAAFTSARYWLCAVQARHHGRQQLGDLFDAAATEAYLHHFAKEAVLAGLIGTEAENLHDLIRKEQRDSDEVYRIFAEQADAVGDAEAASCFRRVGEQERERRERLLTAMRDLDPADPAE